MTSMLVLVVTIHGEFIELMNQGGNLEVEVPSPIARVWHTLALEYSRCFKYSFRFDLIFDI